MSNINVVYEIVDDVKNWFEVEQKFYRDFNQLKRDMSFFEEGSQKYRDFLKRIGYKRGKSLEQLKSIQISSTCREIIELVENKAEKIKRLITRIESQYTKSNNTDSIEKYQLKLNLEVNILTLESIAWRNIQKYCIS